MTLIVTSDYQINRVTAPRMPAAPKEYEARYHDQFADILRLYFNRLDAILAQLNATTTAVGVLAPHISASSNIDLYATANNTPTIVAFNTLETNEGFTLNLSGTATCLAAGVYRVAYGLQVANTSNDIHFATVWLRVNNVDVALSGVKFSLPARKNPAQPFEMVAFSEIVFSVNAGDEVALWWATDQAATSGGGLGLYLNAEPTQTTPYVRPSVPSAIGAITFVSALPP